MKLELRDSPGQLVAALMPISDMGGNIKTVIHEHEHTSGKGVLSVEVVIEIPPELLDGLIVRLRERGINVLRLGEERMSYRQSVILIGHLVHTDLGDTIDRIDKTGFAEVTYMSLAMPAINERTSAQFVIKSLTREHMQQALHILRQVAKQKDFLLIEPLEI
ncbi:MAG TPA: amino acid-binding protein [Methanospirillum sp.]|uniref:amino acid-binding protein n=1 Tax=Methanospirillum sp. TaxID=45200 RepID=UPI002CC1D75D|nr:amino acid-binding protein [Methanospirillum sp.]HWQ64216.1 amino acid-binding protein [Methanospirillum sp.]